jgi:hypothetical protein
VPPATYTDGKLCDCTPLDPSKAKYFTCGPPRYICVRICFAKSECPEDEVCEDSQCRKPACAEDAECENDNLQCIGGACVPRIPATDVASCTVDPANLLVRSGQSVTVLVTARNGVGKVIPYRGKSDEVQWKSSNNALKVTAEIDRPVEAALTAFGEATGTISARIGNIPCTAANVVAYGDVPEGKLRVVVASADEHTPIENASVQVNGASLQYGARGSYVFDAASTPARVTVTREGFSSVMLIDVATNDVIVYLKPKLETVKLTGEMTPRSFDRLQDVKGTVHVAVAGHAIQGSFTDFDLASFLGESVKTKIDLGGSAVVETPLPEGAVVGLAENMFKGDFAVNALPGKRTLWSLGGNVVLSDVLGVVSQATSGEDLDIGEILSALLPVLGRLQAGAYSDFESNGPAAVPMDFGPTTLLRIQAKVRTPMLPAFTLLGQEAHLEGTLAIGGLRHPTRGFVPVGFAAGVDNDRNGKTDAVIGPTASDEGYLALRMAPPNGGSEGSPYEVLTLSTRFSQLNSKEEPLVIAGVVSEPATPWFSTNATNEIAVGAVLSPPENIELNLTATPWLKLTDANTSDMYRLDLGADWSVYFPGSAREIDLTGAPVDATKATLHSIRLHRGSGSTYDDVLRFDGADIDDLSAVMDAFTIRPLATQEITRTQE